MNRVNTHLKIDYVISTNKRKCNNYMGNKKKPWRPYNSKKFIFGPELLPL